MPMQALTITELPEALDVVKEMVTCGDPFCDDYCVGSRKAVADSIKAVMDDAVQDHLDDLPPDIDEDRRNGTYQRNFMTRYGDIFLDVPRTRHYCPTEVLRDYARRERSIDQLIASCFFLGLSTRKVATALLPMLGRRISPTTVSRVAKSLDVAVEAFHKRPLRGQYRALILDGVVLKRKTGMGPQKHRVLVALGLRHDGKKEVLDFKLAGSESEAEWTGFLTSLFNRGLEGDRFEIICVDGGTGLAAALPTVYHDKPVQRCWAHKMRNVLDKVRKADHDAAHDDLKKVMHAKTEKAARSAARRFQDRWEGHYPRAVKCLRDDLDELVTCWRYKNEDERRAVRTTNHIERSFVEVRRRTRPMGVFQNKTSMERILLAVFMEYNSSQKTGTPFALTHKS